MSIAGSPILETYPTGKYNFEKMVRNYAAENHDQFANVMLFLSTRNSLECAAELLGIQINDPHLPVSRAKYGDLLNQLGRFLDSRGYRVPKAWEDGSAQHYIGPGSTDVPASLRIPENLIGNRMEANVVGEFRLTREQYLLERRTKSRTQIAKEQGVTAPTLIYHLGKWGLKDAGAEQQEIAKLNVSVEITASKDEADSNQHDIGDQRSPNQHNAITITIPSTPADWPEELHLDRVGRDQLILIGVTCLRNAAAWAHKELADLLGDDAAEAHVQSFITRKCAQILSEVNENEPIEAV